MKLKRFRAPDMRQALNLVREQFGPDAVIMSNQTLDDGVEVVAAIDLNPTEEKNLGIGVNKSEQTAKVSHLEWQHDTEFRELKSELNGLKELLAEHLHSADNEIFNLQQPIKASIKHRLDQLQLSKPLQRYLLDQITGNDLEAAWHTLQSQLANLIPTQETDFTQTGGAIAVIGPSGSGKTMTIAKLMARCINQFTRKNCALITMDTHRVGATDTLVTFGRLFDIPVLIAENAEQLYRHLDMLKHMRCVLIDTPSAEFTDTKNALENSPIKIKCCLTIPANQTKLHLDKIVKAFNTPQLSCVVLTKIDEASSIGETISVLIENELPIAFIANGQRIPEDLSRCHTQHLVRLALQLQSQTEQVHKGVKHVIQTV